LEDIVKKKLLLVPLVGLLLMGCIITKPRIEMTPTAMPAATPAPSPTATPDAAVESQPTAFPALPWGWDDLSPYRQAMLPAFAGDIDRFADATRYAIDVDIDPEDGTFTGQAVVRYTNQESESLSEVVFRLLPNTPGYGGALDVSQVTVNGAQVEPTLQLAESALYVPLEAALAPGQMVEIGLDFVGTVPTDDSSGYAQYGYVDGVLALPNFYPMIPVYDDEGWNVELAPSHGDATFTDTSLYAVRIALPADMVLAVSGVVVASQDNDDGTKSYTVATGPMRDFTLVASADYQTRTDRVGNVLVTSHFLPGDDAGGRLALDYTVRSLKIYEKLIGPYPFTELDVVATPTLAGGIEYPGLIVVAARLYGQEGGFFEFATVHEVAHQWWYSLVGSDQLDEPWLDEALTQYTSLLYFEHRYGQDVAEAVAEEAFWGPYESLLQDEQDMPAGLPVEAYSHDLYGPVVYSKGPLFFLEMRQQVGDKAFYEILRTYFEQYRYGVAYPQNLMAVAEQVSGQDIDPLYEEWILGPEE
jgi:aminopeptidase N